MRSEVWENKFDIMFAFEERALLSLFQDRMLFTMRVSFHIMSFEKYEKYVIFKEMWLAITSLSAPTFTACFVDRHQVLLSQKHIIHAF